MSKLTKILLIIDGLSVLFFLLLMLAAYNAPFDTGNPQGLLLPGVILLALLVITIVLIVIDLRYKK